MKLSQAKVLIVEDEEFVLKSLSRLVEGQGYVALKARDGNQALEKYHTQSPDVILLDLKLPGVDGMVILDQVKDLDPELPVIIITAYANVHGAVESIRAGAYDYLAKPFEHDQVVRIINSALKERKLTQKVKQLSNQIEGKDSLTRLMGPSEAVCQLVFKVSRVAKSDFTVIIQGESGSGKELVAQAIHHNSPRSSGPFVVVDCGAIQETLLESELFGHEKGAFTGAISKKQGKFECAKNGTLFLDEISNLTLGSQAKLLRALQEKTICRIGSTSPFEVDVRVLVASNQNLTPQERQKSFRKDLYYRLNDFTITIPPLRERKEDIPYLANRFLEATNVELGKYVNGFSKSAIETMLAFDWPGNVRQLKATIRRAVLLSDKIIETFHLDIDLESLKVSSDNPDSGTAENQTRENQTWQNQPWGTQSLHEIIRKNTISLERKIISRVLKHTRGNKAKAARLLKIDYKTIHTKIKNLEITNH